ncbi:MAG TPA: T9SS type A sorting domain-containing protein [Bacteroidia bacterium]|nr:T9SS type A sorting domain-containing protein [Bacteroidia bacterium]
MSPLDFNRPNQGLASSEAIRKLQGFGDAIMGSYSVYPNPFSNTVTFKFIVSTGDVLECTIYDLNGKKVKALVNTLVISPYSELVWDGSDDDGNKLPSGIYLSSVRTSEGIQTLKIVKQ